MTGVSVISTLLNRRTLHAYLNTLTGSALRLILQGVYFVVLVSTLSVADFGVFASSIALALIIANGGTFGFTAPLFRAATTRKRLAGYYIGGIYVYLLGAIPLSLAIAAGLHLAIMHQYLSMTAFLAIVASEAVCWRIGDALWQLNLGLGRYTRAAAVVMVNSAARTLAVILFALAPQTGLEQWAIYYLTANVIGITLCITLFHPRIRPRWSLKIFRGRLPEAWSYAAASMIQSMQIELDKFVILLIAGQNTAGLYAVALRIIDLISVPTRSFFPIYAQMLMRRRESLKDFGVRCRIEIAIILVTTVIFVCLVELLKLYPTMLGTNIAAAAPWLAGLFVLPAAKVLLDYHRELYFAANRIALFTAVTLLLLAIKIPAIAAIALTAPSFESWVWPLDLLWAGLYALSATLAWKLLGAPARPAAPVQASRPVATRPA